MKKSDSRPKALLSHYLELGVWMPRLYYGGVYVSVVTVWLQVWVALLELMKPKTAATPPLCWNKK